ncbi:hypothetical protein GCM10023310_72320 [Paenibacillus vulneris]|uniref:Helix-turn-helix domain-containing protein n=1 Tax=Paenibacillus vulneris TaxID=1133364 RepID=A0ABW3UX20_9BACL
MPLTVESLYKVRSMRGLSLYDIARLAGVSESYISKIEKGQRPLTAKLARKIIEKLDLTPDRLEQLVRAYDEFNYGGLRYKRK